MEFFDGNQQSRGMKSTPLVNEHLSRITGVTRAVLRKDKRMGSVLRDACLGQRMSWAAHRNTSREEDLAYCLLGIFQVNMPLLYGEGSKAFIRLQETILASSTDLSILSWTQTSGTDQQYRGIFSRHPYEFRGSRQCRLDYSQFSTQDEIIITNKGARTETSLFCLHRDEQQVLPDVETHFLSLGCCVYDDYIQGIWLKRIKDIYVRAEPTGLMRIDSSMRRIKARAIYLARDVSIESGLTYAFAEQVGLRVEMKAPAAYALEICESWPRELFNTIPSTFTIGGRSTFIGYLSVAVQQSEGSCCEDKRGHSAKFMVIIVKSDYHVNIVSILGEEEAERLTTDSNVIRTMDSRTARHNLTHRLAHITRSSPHLEFVVSKHHGTQSLMRVDSQIIDGQRKYRPELGRPLTDKIVEICLDVVEEGQGATCFEIQLDGKTERSNRRSERIRERSERTIKRACKC